MFCHTPPTILTLFFFSFDILISSSYVLYFSIWSDLFEIMAVVPGTGPPDPKLIPDIPSDLSMRYAHAFAGLAVALSIIGTLVFGGRMYTRFFPVYRMQADDWVCMVAYVSTLIENLSDMDQPII